MRIFQFDINIIYRKIELVIRERACITTEKFSATGQLIHDSFLKNYHKAVMQSTNIFKKPWFSR